MNEEVRDLFETLCETLCEAPIFPDPVDYGSLEPEDESYDDWLHSLENSI